MRLDNFVCEQSDTVAEDNVVAPRFKTQVNFTVRHVIGMVIEIRLVSIREVSHLIRVDNPDVDVVTSARCTEGSGQMSRAGYVKGIVLISASANRKSGVDNSLPRRRHGGCRC